VEPETNQSHPDVTCQKIIICVKSKDHMWKGKVDSPSNHLRTIVWVLFVYAMSSKRHQKIDSKAHHLKLIAESDKSLSLLVHSSVTYDWHSMRTVIQNMDDITLFWAINISFLNGVITNQIIFLIPIQLREISS